MLLEIIRSLIFFLTYVKHIFKKIARENRHSEDDAKMALFSEWLKTSFKASWRDVIEALKKMNERAQADEIEQKLRIKPEQQRAPIDFNPQSYFLNDIIIIIYYSTGLDAYEEEHVDVVKPVAKLHNRDLNH